MDTKKCNKCNIDKTLDNFYYRKNRDIYESTCKLCCAELAKEKRKDPVIKQKSKTANATSYQKNIEARRKRDREYYAKNKNKLKMNMKKYYQDNKEKALSDAKQYRKELKEKIQSGDYVKPDIKDKTCTKCNINKKISEFTYRKTRNQYESTCKECNKIRERERREKNRDTINIRRKEIRKPKTIQQKIKGSLRKRLNKLVSNRKKKNLYCDLLGCELSFLMEWFENIFRLDKHLGMTWNNYGDVWQIDHVVPCASFDLTIEKNQKICFHWTNLCPVLTPYNLSKQNKIVHLDIIQQVTRVRDFTNKQQEKTTKLYRSLNYHLP